MENPAEAGIIYAYSHLNTMTLAAYQSAAVDGFPVTDPGPTDPNATVIPDFDGDSNNDLIDVHEVTIKYRVKDGWENISDIKERRVYIYISKQYANSAFYATPLYTKDGQPFLIFMMRTKLLSDRQILFLPVCKKIMMAMG